MVKEKLLRHDFYSKLADIIGIGTKYFYRHSISLDQKATKISRGN